MHCVGKMKLHFIYFFLRKILSVSSDKHCVRVGRGVYPIDQLLYANFSLSWNIIILYNFEKRKEKIL
jgi:hypothetical protein